MSRTVPQIPTRRLYRRATAAHLLNCSISLLKRLEKDGRLTPIRLGSRDVFYAVAQVHRLAGGEDAR
jgi:hypothetical protein